MGAAPSKRRPDTRQRPSLTGVRSEDLFALLAPFYGFKHEVQFDEMLERLWGIFCTDLGGDPDTPLPKADELSVRRSQGYRLASTMRSEAAAALAAIQAVRAATEAFNRDVVRFEPLLHEQIFKGAEQDPTTTSLPEQIDILEHLERFEHWSGAVALLQRVAELPVRATLARGPMRGNSVLYKALALCRSYWVGDEKLSWGMFRLKELDVRDKNLPSDVNGVCESFVFDLLTYNHIPFTLKSLASTWQQLDLDISNAARPPKSKAPR